MAKLPTKDLEWHFLMRHHNVPSRLLDWSKGSFIGLYFATRKSLDSFNEDKSKENVDSAVWMLEPRRLSEMHPDHKRNIYGSYFNNQNKIEDLNYPLPMIPDLVAPRIEAHIGRFTLHPFSDASKNFQSGTLMNFAKDSRKEDGISYLVKIIIPHNTHFSIARSLRSTGVSDMNFSQDLDGLSKELALRVNIGRQDHNRYVREITEEQV